MLTKIHVSDHLTMEIEGKADMRGVSIKAAHLEARFGELLLASVQDIIDDSSYGVSVSLSLAEKMDKLKSLTPGFHSGNRKAHIVREMTELLGSETANIVVRNALRLNGAMIACAERDDDGTLTDHGNLTLQVGELFVQHIYDYDHGHTLGASLSGSFGEKGNVPDKEYYFKPVIGLHDKSGTTRATIGGARVFGVTGKIEGEALNRDVKDAQSFETHIDIDPIKLYFNPSFA